MAPPALRSFTPPSMGDWPTISWPPVGRFGWKAQIPSLTEFSRDAVSVELGLTVPAVDSLVFGTLTDDDAVDDPEISLASLEALTFYVSLLSPPAPKKDVPAGRRLFEFLECTACHIPSLPGLTGDIPAYTDLLLHTTSPADRPGVADGQAGPLQYRTPPLWGLSDTGPYMHDGRFATLEEVIDHYNTGGVPSSTIDPFMKYTSGGLSLAPSQKADLIAFLHTLTDTAFVNNPAFSNPH